MNDRIADQSGYTLAELLVVLVIFMIVLTLTTTSFNRIVSSSGQTVRSAETEIEGLIGLEVLRTDLELAGFGLPWSFQLSGINYAEAEAEVVQVPDCPRTEVSLYNDAPGNPPRAIISWDRHLKDNAGLNDSDYLVLKGTALANSKISRKWCYLGYSSPAGVVLKPPKDPVTELNPEKDDADKDRVVVINSAVRGGVTTKELVMGGADKYYFDFDVNSEAAKPFLPTRATDNYVVYGLGKKTGIAPFNRADYYLDRSDGISARCAPHTGTLYKSVLNRGGTFNARMPLLDCVADMQVIYGFSQDSRLNGQIDLHDDKVEPSNGVTVTARDIREQVREIRVYILAQEGKYDRDYVYRNRQKDASGEELQSKVQVGAFGYGSLFDLKDRIGPGWEHYRWKVYTIVVQPKNLR